MIMQITRAYVRHYLDNNSHVAYVEWIDQDGIPGRTEGVVKTLDRSATLAQTYGDHLGALMARAICHGIEIERETWAAPR